MERIRRPLGTLAVVLLPCSTFLLAILGWWLWVRLGHVSRIIAPSPGAVLHTFGRDGFLLPALWTTVKQVVIGFTLSLFGGFLIAVAIVSIRPIEKTIHPILVGSQVIPKVSMAPLLLIWFGTDAIVLMVFLITFFPLVINSIVGLRSVRVEQIYLARSMRAGWLQTFIKIRFPNSLPYVFSGIKISAALSVTAAVVVEFISATSGIGLEILRSTASLRTETVFVGVTYLALLGLGMVALTNLVERVAIPWHVSQRKQHVRK